MSHPADAPGLCPGTRFRIFAQPPYLPGFAEPETVCLSPPPGAIAPGPGDDRLYVVDALDKRPYRPPRRPPYAGAALPGAEPDTAGHFDHLAPYSRPFKAAQAYASVRLVLEMWERYAAGPIDWHLRPAHARLEVVPQVLWGNAHAGDGYLETGYATNAWGQLRFERPYCLTFDVVAHETGHLILHALMGRPEPRAATLCYAAFHEAFADLSAVLASLHSRRVVERVLQRTQGHLRAQSVLSRIGERSQRHHIRSAVNEEHLDHARLDAHTQAVPLVGALFDVLVAIFEAMLVERGLVGTVTPGAGCLASGLRQPPSAARAEAYAGRHDAFRAALWGARDTLGRTLAMAVARLSPRDLTCPALLEALLAADQREHGGRWREVLTACFARRGVSVARQTRRPVPPAEDVQEEGP